MKHTATVLADGTALLAGGVHYSVVGNPRACNQQRIIATLATAELFR